MKPLLTMTEAKAAGLTRYFTGEPCASGHVAERHVSGRSCVVCQKGHKRRWEKANPEGQAARSRKWFLENKDKAGAATKAWALANQERDRQRRDEYRRANRGQYAANAMRRHAAKLERTPAWADHDLIDSFYALAGIYRDFGHEVEVDHVVPLRGRRVSGLHVHDNLQIIPSHLNKAKSNHFAI
jgi:hypothetical protein